MNYMEYNNWVKCELRLLMNEILKVIYNWKETLSIVMIIVTSQSVLGLITIIKIKLWTGLQLYMIAWNVCSEQKWMCVSTFCFIWLKLRIETWEVCSSLLNLTFDPWPIKCLLCRRKTKFFVIRFIHRSYNSEFSV